MSDRIIVPYTDDEVWEIVQKDRNRKQGLQGYCQFFIDGQCVDQGFNLVVGQGRDWVAQRLFNLDGTTYGSPEDLHEHVLGLFAVGAGGATVGPGNVVTLNGPFICDTNLIKAVSLGVTSYLDEPFTYNDPPGSDPYDIFKSEWAVKPIDLPAHGGSIVLEQVDYGGTCQWYSKVKCTCVVPDGEPQGLPVGGVVPLSEAGLYIAEPGAGPPDWVAGTARMFAHICFAPKWKEKESEFQIIWYILM